MKHINLFNSKSEYELYKNSLEYITPELSLIEGENEVQYKPENHNVICTYNVTTPGNISICYSIDNVLSIIVDGVSMDPVKKYNFEAGDHTVEFVLIDRTLTSARMFANCTNITSIRIPTLVTNIGKNITSSSKLLMFIKVSDYNSAYDSRDNCNAIIETATNTLLVGTVNTIIPDSIISVGEGAFKESGLESITIPDSVTSIGRNAFNNCESLESIHLGKNIASIDRSSFTKCDNVTSITMDENDYYYAENNVLVDKSNYSTLIISNTEHITIPERVKVINTCSLRTILKTITLNEQLEQLGGNCFRNCSNLESIVIPDSVTYVGDSAFMSCSNLKTCVLSNNLQEILNDTFIHCESLESIIIPDSVTTIGENAFSHCNSLTSITIGNSVNNINGYAFGDCASLSEIICLGTEPITFDSNVFFNLPSNGVLKVPAGSNTGLESQVLEGWTVEYIGEAPSTPEQLDSWVDLGLPSGTLWSNKNIGATTPEEYGLYFAWGETEGYEKITDTKKFKWGDYKLCGGSSSTLTKYNNKSSYGTVDNLTVLEQVDDAAYQVDNSCRMPTKADLNELKANTTSSWETLNDVNGIRFTSKVNGNSIFVPAAGGCLDGTVYSPKSCCYLWSSSLGSSNSKNACCLLADSRTTEVNELNSRYFGFSVRPVKS